MKTEAMLIDVKRFSVHDGPGVRTTLFFKGCPLCCIWCHNPESISHKPQLGYFEHKCVNCGECVSACPEKAHSIVNGKHYFDRSKCVACGKCEDVCLGNALRFYGKNTTVEEALELALEDRDFYGSDGGVTLSGGEPLLQADFCYKLLTKVKENGVNTAVDTCGCVEWDCFEKVQPVTDIFLFDFKHSDSSEHMKLTGQGNEKIISNLRRLSESGARIEIRIPLIPGCNDSESNLRNTGELLGSLNLEKVKILPYHAMARTKYEALGMPDKMPQKETPDDIGLQRAVAILQSFGVKAFSVK
jgi:pyruvate formate lyase activating enzyme